jgi:hypothetical protein
MSLPARLLFHGVLRIRCRLTPGNRNGINHHPQLVSLLSHSRRNQNPDPQNPGKAPHWPSHRQKCKSLTQLYQVPLLTQPSSLSSCHQTTNHATGSDRRGPGKTQVLPYPAKSSSTLSTKARIAEDMAKGPVSQGQSKYKGMRIPKKVNPPGESGSPVISTTNPQSPLDSPQRAPMLRASNERSGQTRMEKAPVQQFPPPPLPQPEVPSHNVEADRMEVDEPGFVRSSYCCHFSHFHQPGLLLLLSSRKI